MQPNVLLIEDDQRLADLLVTYLGGRGFSVDHYGTGRGGMDALAAAVEAPAMVLLDVMLPDADGFDLCREIRATSRHTSVPIIMLTARGEEMDRIVGLELGADDYLPKPFNPRELVARMKAIGRRQAAANPPPALASSSKETAVEPLVFGRLTIDVARRQVRVDGQEHRLTAHQFDILCAFAERPGRVLSREQLMQAVRHTALEAFDRSIDVHISRIRHAIEDDPKEPRRIQTIRGAGYLFSSVQD